MMKMDSKVIVNSMAKNNASNNNEIANNNNTNSGMSVIKTEPVGDYKTSGNVPITTIFTEGLNSIKIEHSLDQIIESPNPIKQEPKDAEEIQSTPVQNITSLNALDMVRQHCNPTLAHAGVQRNRGGAAAKVKEEDEENEEGEDSDEEDMDDAEEAEILAANTDYVDDKSDKEASDVEDMDGPIDFDKTIDEYYDETSRSLDSPDPDERSDSTYSPDFMDSDDGLNDDDIDDPDYDEHGMNSPDLSLVKHENIGLEGDSSEKNVTRADGVLASSQPCRIIELGGLKVETYGDYSKCPKCEKNIKSTFIIRHIKLHEAPTSILKCPFGECKTSFTRSNNLYRHLKVVHNDDYPYLCVYKSCTEKFEDSRHLREHVTKVHRKGVKREMEELEAANMRYKCEFPGCEREYGKRQHLKEHFRKHTGEMRYACEVCGERFFVHGHMKRHLYSHTGIKPHACRWKCGAIFASYGGRMKHERAQHSENPYKLDCDICGRPFRFERELDKHKLTHLAPFERKAYRCSYCNIIFDSISHRERHEQRHKDNDTFQCEDCNKMFKNEKNLRHHFKTHHESVQQRKPAKPGEKKKKEPPKYPCHMCDTPVLFALTALRRHLARKHSTNYKCTKEGCDKTFAKQYQFDAHVKLHTHRSCHICEKQFKRKQNADIHLMGVHGLTKEDLAELGR